MGRGFFEEKLYTVESCWGNLSFFLTKGDFILVGTAPFPLPKTFGVTPRKNAKHFYEG